MKKQNKVIAAVLGVLVVGGIALASTSPSLFQGNIASVNNLMSRGEFASMLVKNADLNTSRLTDKECNIFPDVKRDNPYFKDICLVHKNDFMFTEGNDHFAPNSGLSRAQAAAFVYRTFDISYDEPLPAQFSDIKNGSWYYDYVNQLAAHGFFSKEVKIDSKFQPGELMTKSAALRWFRQVDTIK